MARFSRVKNNKTWLGEFFFKCKNHKGHPGRPKKSFEDCVQKVKIKKSGQLLNFLKNQTPEKAKMAVSSFLKDQPVEKSPIKKK